MHPSPTPHHPFFDAPPTRRLAWLLGLLVLAAALYVNRGVVDFDFLYLRDDDVNLTLNPHMGGVDAERLRWMFTDVAYARRYMPLGWLGFSAIYSLGGLDPALYHTAGLVLYAANTLLVYGILLCGLRLFRHDAAAGLGPWPCGAAALGAAWWSLHPLRVETTAWVSGNLYGISAGWFLASVLAYLQTYRSAGAARTAWLAATTAGCAASLLTYPVALAGPAAIVGMDWLYCRTHGADFRRLLREKAALLVLLAAGLAVTLAARSASKAFGAVPSLEVMPLSRRLAQAAYIAAYYIWRPWWPFHLSPVYDTLIGFKATDAPFVASFAGAALATLGAVLCRRRFPAVTAAWFGYLALAAPYFGLTESPHFPSDRYGYLLTVIIAAAVAAGLAGVARRGARAAVATLAAAMVCGFALLSHRQLRIWSDDRTQHDYVARMLTRDPILSDFTSRQLILQFMRGDEAGAAPLIAARLAQDPASPGFRRAATIVADKRRVAAFYGDVPYLAILHDKLALEFAGTHQFREADDHFGAALALDDRFYQAAYDRALVLIELGRPREAIHSFLLSEARAPAPLPLRQRREFLWRLKALGAARSDPDIVRAADRALAG